MIGQDGPLTSQELSTLQANKNAELLRIVRKAVSHHYAKVCSRIVAISSEKVEMTRGELRGLSAAYNLIQAGTVDLEQDNKRSE